MPAQPAPTRLPITQDDMDEPGREGGGIAIAVLQLLYRRGPTQADALALLLALPRDRVDLALLGLRRRVRVVATGLGPRAAWRIATREERAALLEADLQDDAA